MADVATANASPVIVLARAGWLELLHVRADRILLPSQVATEIRRHSSTDPAMAALATTQWLDVVEVGPIDPRILGYQLDPGESAVLTWALANPGIEAILDDRAARRCARVLGIPYVGTLGVILSAKEQGVIAAARPVVGDVIRAGLYLAPHIVTEAFVSVGE